MTHVGYLYQTAYHSIRYKIMFENSKFYYTPVNGAKTFLNIPAKYYSLIFEGNLIHVTLTKQEPSDVKENGLTEKPTYLFEQIRSRDNLILDISISQ
jgi:hypothetical protein